ncbi:MAG: hypothetical protein IPM97_08215 [Bdellovibrionaceae bacterium]|nr:hypothetical protein [Pseudobdellovibrionaceae bacterium]
MQGQKIISFKNQIFSSGTRIGCSNIRQLVNSAYKELADVGLNYTATYQDEIVTRERISKGKALLLKKEGQLLEQSF